MNYRRPTHAQNFSRQGIFSINQRDADLSSINHLAMINQQISKQKFKRMGYAMTKSKGVGRGGKRDNAGRKRKPHDPVADGPDQFPAAAGAIVKALAVATQAQFVLAMAALGADIDETRLALGLSREGFSQNFGRMLAELD